MEKGRKKVAVVGGGITGLTAAWTLLQDGIEIVLFEASDRVGGAIQTRSKDGFRVECGPNTLMDTHPQITQLIDALGLKRVPASQAAKKRFIVRDGQPIALPDSPLKFFTSNAFSRRAKFRLLREPFISSRSNREESLSAFVQRRLGQEFLDYAIEPFVGGVYAGNPDLLSTRDAFPKLYALEANYGSLIRGAVLGAQARKKRAERASKDAAMFSFSDGLEMLPRRLAEQLDHRIQLNSPVEHVAHLPDGKWRVNGDIFSEVILSLPAHQIARLSLPFEPHFFSTVYYPPLATLSLGFPVTKGTHPLDGFGMLIPRVENRFLLGSLFLSTLFPERAPQGMVLLTMFAGGAQFPERAECSPEELEEQARKDLVDLLGIQTEPVFRYHQFHAQAIPQYNVGYGDFLEKIEALEKAYTGLYFAGSYRGGISVGDTMQTALQTAQKIKERCG